MPKSYENMSVEERVEESGKLASQMEELREKRMRLRQLNDEAIQRRNLSILLGISEEGLASLGEETLAELVRLKTEEATVAVAGTAAISANGEGVEDNG